MGQWGAAGTLNYCWWECKRYNHFGKELAISLKIKQAFIGWPVHSDSRYLSKRNESVYPQKHLTERFIETFKGEGINKQEWTDICVNMDKSQNNYAKWRQSDKNEQDSIYVKLWTTQRTVTESRSVSLEMRKGHEEI